jgi:predicted Zn-dependent protease
MKANSFIPALALGMCLLANLVMFGSGCTTLEGQPLNLLSTQEEVKMGAQLAAQVEQQEKVLQDAQIQEYIDMIGNRLVGVAPRQDVTYTFEVIDAPDTINAFALPGGYLYVYTGLLKLCENEAELASVMAHEIAHVAEHHHGESFTRQYGVQLLSDLVLGENPHAAAQVTADLLGTGVMMRYSRDNEREADLLGMNMLVHAGYNPDAMLTFLRKLVAADQQAGGLSLPIFASHPPTQERMQSLQAMANQYPLEMRQQADLNAERYQQTVLSRLK